MPGLRTRHAVHDPQAGPGLQFCSVENRGHITEITLRRPEVLNALHAPAHFELAKVFDDFAADSDRWVAILTGSGDRAFCAGNDLKHQAAGGDMSRPPSGFGGITARFDLDKPVIAAVNGLALGGGFELALACDLVVASESAVFGLPEPRVGLAAFAGGIQRLGRQVGMKQAMGMILTGRHVGAAQAQAMGLLNEVVPADELMDAARRWAASIAECSPLSVRASKQALLRGLDEPSLQDAMRNQREYPASRAMLASADFVEGPKAFAEKRKPNWLGR